jgi:hypothetical protein
VLLQLLDRDLEVAEEQHQTALGAHLMVLDSLLDLQVGTGHVAVLVTLVRLSYKSSIDLPRQLSVLQQRHPLLPDMHD